MLTLIVLWRSSILIEMASFRKRMLQPVRTTTLVQEEEDLYAQVLDDLFLLFLRCLLNMLQDIRYRW